MGSLFPACNVTMQNCHACCPSISSHRFLAEGGGHDIDDHYGGHDDHHDSICMAGYLDSGVHEHIFDKGTVEDVSTGYPTCNDHKWHEVHLIEEILFYGTIAILSLFMLENIIECIAMCPL